MEKEEKRYYVYVYLDPTKPGTYRYLFKHGAYCPKFEPIYIGAGKDRRYRFFLLNKSRAKNEDLYNEVSQIRERNSWEDPIVKKVKIGLSREESFKWETKLIIAIGRLDLNTGPLFNETNGGLGCTGMIQSEESKKKTGENSKKYWSDSEFRENMRKKHLGENHFRTILTEKKVLKIRKLKEKGWFFSNLAKRYKVGQSCIYHIVERHSWVHI